MTASTAHVTAAPRRLSASIVMVGAIAYCVVLATLSAIVPLSVLPSIGASLHASGALLNWTVISSTAASAVATGVFPPLASIFGQRMMLAVAMGAVTWAAAQWARDHDRRFRQGLARARHVITVSEFVRREVIKHLGIAPASVTAVP